jgi:hypothetical protein
MSDPDTETVVRRWVAAWNQGDVEAAVALLSPAYVRHDANLPESSARRRRSSSCKAHSRRFPALRSRCRPSSPTAIWSGPGWSFRPTRRRVSRRRPNCPAGAFPVPRALSGGRRQARRAVGGHGCGGPAPAARGHSQELSGLLSSTEKPGTSQPYRGSSRRVFGDAVGPVTVATSAGPCRSYFAW